MNEYDETLDVPASEPQVRQQHRFIMLIIVVIVAALLLVMVAMALYESSGTAQVDLSRPGYSAVRDQTKEDSSFESFPASGPIDKDSLEAFEKLYDTRTKQITSVKAFENNVLSDKVLRIEAE